MRACCLTVIAFVSLQLPAFAQSNVRDAWNQVFADCGKSDLFGSRMLYFGPSNNVGPGSVWRRESDGSLRLRFELADAIPDNGKRAKLIRVNDAAKCDRNKKRSWNISLGLPFVNRLVDAALSAEFGRAQKATVSIKGYAVDLLKEVPFKIALQDKSIPAEYRDDLSKDDRIIFENSIRISGLQVELEFEPKVGAEVRGKYKGQQFNTGDEGAKLSVKWSGDSKVTLETEQDVYIGGVAGKWRDVLGLEEGQLIVPVGLDPNAKMSSERKRPR
jgi:hypothetical protein